MPKKEFTVTEVMALQESMDKKLDVIGEHIPYILEKLKRIDVIEEKVTRTEENIELIKMSLRRKVDIEDFQALEKRVIRLEKKLA